MQIRTELQKNPALTQKFQQSNVSMPNTKKYNFLTRSMIRSVTMANNSNTILHLQSLGSFHSACPQSTLPQVQGYPLCKPPALSSSEKGNQNKTGRDTWAEGITFPTGPPAVSLPSPHYPSSPQEIKPTLALSELARDQHIWASKVQRKRTC